MFSIHHLNSLWQHQDMGMLCALRKFVLSFSRFKLVTFSLVICVLSFFIPKIYVLSLSHTSSRTKHTFSSESSAEEQEHSYRASLKDVSVRSANSLPDELNTGSLHRTIGIIFLCIVTFLLGFLLPFASYRISLEKEPLDHGILNVAGAFYTIFLVFSFNASIIHVSFRSCIIVLGK